MEDASSDNFAIAVMLGDAERVRAELQRDLGLATRHDPQTGRTALHTVCASRRHQAEPALTQGLAAVARMLLDAGADPVGTTSPPSQWTPLRCAIAAANTGPSNRAIVELLLERGAVPGDHDVYLAGFAPDRLELLPLLLDRVADPAELSQALAASVSRDDVDAVRLLLEGGADPRRYLDDDGEPVPAVWAATRAGCSAELVALLLEHGADPSLPGADGRTPYRVATAAGRADVLDVLRRHGVNEDATPAELFLSACMRGDRSDAQRRLDEDPRLVERLSDDERAAFLHAAGSGNAAAVALMLDLGFPTDTRRSADGATALHVAAFSGAADTVELLLDRGADLEARDSFWNSAALAWAAVGSAERPADAPTPDWLETVRILLDHGARADEIDLSPDVPKAPSAEVGALLRARL